MSAEQTPERDFLYLRGHSTPPISNTNNPEEEKLEMRQWVKSLTPEQKRSYRYLRKTLYQILGLPVKFGLGIGTHLQSVRENPQRLEELALRSCLLTAGMYGISGTEEEIVSRIKDHGKKANSVITHIEREILTDPFVTFEMSNEVTSANTPTELLLIAYDSAYPEKARFEAIRKLALMRLDLGNERKRVDNKPSEQFSRFLNFLDEYVWSKGRKISETTTKYILSTHDMENYGCIDVSVLDARPSKLQANQRITPMSRRAFTTLRLDGKPGQDIEVYTPMREKDDISQILKDIRKSTENPNEAFDDEVGAMIIVDKSRDLELFDQRLTQAATDAGSLVMNEDMSNSIDNGHYTDGNPGSSPLLKALKSPVRVHGTRAEIMALLLPDYIDYLYRDDVAHDEYEVNRFFESGSAELLFPGRLFKYIPGESQQRIIQALRRKKRVEMGWYEPAQTQIHEEIPVDNQTSLITWVNDRVARGWRIIRGLRAS